MKRIGLRMTLLMAATGMLACQARLPVMDDPYYAPVYSGVAPGSHASAGSLYDPVSTPSLFEDQRARRVGDVLTVLLSERTVSSKSAETSSSKKSDVETGGSVWFSNKSVDVDLSADRSFDGEAAADQSNSLQGSISVTVADVLPNGSLVIRGEKWMTLTAGREFIRISGIVRPNDILPDNSVLSTRIADARITYSGTGELADPARTGWLQRIFNSPFWYF